MRFYANEQLSPRKSLTPEGFLICQNVPIARVGVMVYGEGETPVDIGKDDIVHIERTEDEVFRKETISSFEGKPVTLDHPVDFVDPQNWKSLAKGIAQNVRRGDGPENNLLFADLLITDAEAIREVQSGLREISCGYDADYEQLEPGRGVQRNIIGNHIALVERGRCGPRCAIGDKETIAMAGKRTVWDRIRTAFKAKDEAALEEALEEAKTADDVGEEEEAKKDKDKSETSDAALKALAKQVRDQGKILARLVKDSEEKEKSETEDEDEEGEEEAADEDGEEGKGKTADSIRAPTFAQWKDAMSRAEILAPGIRLPTLDAKATPKKMRDALCGCKRRALDAASTGEHADRLQSLLSGQSIKSAPCATVDALFVAASEMVKSANNAGGIRSAISTKDFGTATTAADINKRNRDYWGRK